MNDFLTYVDAEEKQKHEEQKRKVEDEKLAAYQRKRQRAQQVRLAAEDEVQPCHDGVASDSDAEEVESVWKPSERKIKPDLPGMRAERLTKADFRFECKEDDYLDAMYGDPEDQLEEVPIKGSGDDSEGEIEENSMEDDDRESDEESDDSYD
ncbi:convicilin-like [Papaver somniferum]|uniref:convicilin-like n=1 Tax=Papaver somniferum TaxID=3469 RepID=UPI000E6F6B91|nr:convicilin-like [Papaver somniferum]